METLRELLEGTDDKFGILTDMDKLIQHNITVGKLFELWEEFLSEEEKSRLVDTEFFTRTSNPNMKRRIIEYIKDDAKKLEMLEDEELISEMSEWQISTILQTLGEQGKEQLLRNIEFVRRCKLDNYTIKNNDIIGRSSKNKAIIR